MYDILIKNGVVVDGSGNAASNKDIALKGDLIAEVSAVIPSDKAESVIDATGMIVAPGFVDITSHSDTTWSIFDYPGQESMLTQGVTTILGGNCGSSLAPLVNAESLNSIRKWTDVSRININWQTFSEFFNEFEKREIGVNFASLVGHGTLRRGIIGDREKRLEVNEMEKIKFLLDEALSGGAFGMSTGLAYSHEAAADIDELIDMARMVMVRGGIYKTHLRSEGHQGLLAAINEAVNIARETGVAVIMSHLKAIGRGEWKYLPRAFEMIQRAQSDGMNIHFDTFPYLRTGSHLYQLLPHWAREGGFSKFFARLRDPVELEKIITAMKKLTLHYDRIIIASAKDLTIVGKTIDEISQKTGLSPEGTIANILIVNEGRVSIFNRNLSSRNLLKIVRAKESFIASDGAGYSKEHQKSGMLVHPRCFGAFTHFLHHFVRDRKLMSWEEGIGKISSGPAQAVGMTGRGFVRKNFFADLVILNPEKIADLSTYSDPYKYSTGVEWVIVNGKMAVRNGEITGIKAGKVLRKNVKKKGGIFGFFREW